jgi:hypothetical protein
MSRSARGISLSCETDFVSSGGRSLDTDRILFDPAKYGEKLAAEIARKVFQAALARP